MILAVLKLDDMAFASKPPSISLIFKRFLCEYGYMFKPTETAIGKDCMFYDKADMSYILHTP